MLSPVILLSPSPVTLRVQTHPTTPTVLLRCWDLTTCPHALEVNTHIVNQLSRPYELRFIPNELHSFPLSEVNLGLYSTLLTTIDLIMDISNMQRAYMPRIKLSSLHTLLDFSIHHKRKRLLLYPLFRWENKGQRNYGASRQQCWSFHSGLLKYSSCRTIFSCFCTWNISSQGVLPLFSYRYNPIPSYTCKNQYGVFSVPILVQFHIPVCL